MHNEWDDMNNRCHRLTTQINAMRIANQKDVGAIEPRDLVNRMICVGSIVLLLAVSVMCFIMM